MSSSTVRLVTVLIVLTGCDEPPRPWDGPVSSADAQRADRPFLHTPAPSASSSAPAERPRKQGANGAHTACYEGFKSSGNERADVTRLGLLCGPLTGMKKGGPLQTALLTAQAPRTSLSFEVTKNACYRIFAAAANPEGDKLDLDVRIVSQRGSQLVKDETNASWVVLPADKPLCSFADDKFVVQLEAEDEHAKTAVEIWQLPPPAGRATP